MDGITWGQVTKLAPLCVVFAGDSAASPVSLKPDGLTLAVGDKVALVRAGSGWGIVCRWVDS